ncbi:hypothetical protein H0H92_005243, partial [Tricholoma furcatifolium]
FDNRLVNYFAQEFKRKNKKDLSSNPRAVRRLRTACERAKRTLSSATQTSIEIDSPFEGIDFYTSLTRARFEELCQDLFRGTLEPVEKVLRDSKIDKANVHEIVLVGGSTRIPRIVKLVSDFFNGKEPNQSVNPDEAVAYGAAVQAAILSGDTFEKTQDLLLLDVAALSLGIETAGALWHSPPVPRGVPQIEVTFDIDANGILNVSASNLITITTTRAVCLRKRSSVWLSKPRSTKLRTRQLPPAKNGLESYAYNLRKSTADEKLADKFEAGDKAKLDGVANNAILWLDASQQASNEEYERKQKKLEAVADPIMQKLHGAAGGAPGGFPGSAPGAGAEDGPSVEEVDEAHTIDTLCVIGHRLNSIMFSAGSSKYAGKPARGRPTFATPLKSAGRRDAPQNTTSRRDRDDAFDEVFIEPSPLVQNPTRPSSAAQLLQKIEDLQKELMAQRTAIVREQNEKMELQEQLEIANHKLSVAAEPQQPTSKDPIQELLENVKPYIRQLVALYNPAIEEGKIKLGERPCNAEKLLSELRFHSDLNNRPSFHDIFLAELYCCLPVRFHQIVLIPDFATVLSQTINNFKSALISNSRKAMVSIVGIDSKYAKAAADRKECLKINSLLSWDKEPGEISPRPPLLYPDHIQERIRRKGSETGYMGTMFQQPMIYHLIKANLFGASSIHDGKSAGAPSYAQKWNMKAMSDFPLNVIPVFTVIFVAVLSHHSSFSAGADSSIPRGGWRYYLEFLLGQMHILRYSGKFDHQFEKILAMFQDIVFDGKVESDGEDLQADLDRIDDSENALLDDVEAESLCGSLSEEEEAERFQVDQLDALSSHGNGYLVAVPESSARSKTRHQPSDSESSLSSLSDAPSITAQHRLPPSPPAETQFHPAPAPQVPKTPPQPVHLTSRLVPPATPITRLPAAPRLLTASSPEQPKAPSKSGRKGNRKIDPSTTLDSSRGNDCRDGDASLPAAWDHNSVAQSSDAQPDARARIRKNKSLPTLPKPSMADSDRGTSPSSAAETTLPADAPPPALRTLRTKRAKGSGSTAPVQPRPTRKRWSKKASDSSESRAAVPHSNPTSETEAAPVQQATSNARPLKSNLRSNCSTDPPENGETIVNKLAVHFSSEVQIREISARRSPDLEPSPCSFDNVPPNTDEIATESEATESEDSAESCQHHRIIRAKK